MKKGFTFIELVIAMAIVAILAAAALFAVNKIQIVNKKNVCTVSVEQVLAGIERYKRITGSYPSSQSEFEASLTNTVYFEIVPQNPYWNQNDTAPEKGWLWDPDTLIVRPGKP